MKTNTMFNLFLSISLITLVMLGCATTHGSKHTSGIQNPQEVSADLNSAKSESRPCGFCGPWPF